jgi:hypothetical protein
MCLRRNVYLMSKQIIVIHTNYELRRRVSRRLKKPDHRIMINCAKWYDNFVVNATKEHL